MHYMGQDVASIKVVDIEQMNLWKSRAFIVHKEARQGEGKNIFSSLTNNRILYKPNKGFHFIYNTKGNIELLALFINILFLLSALYQYK